MAVSIYLSASSMAAVFCDGLHDGQFNWGSMMNDQILFCVQCEEPFAFNAIEQEKYRQRDFDPPRRCPTCRQHRMRTDDAHAGRNGRRRS
ncbi:MAG: zinc-ribbon domain containing protein [Desulfobacterales bacterium]|nr:zinc-ribbon domain containing protein [Desulfobacterales bacterium]